MSSNPARARRVDWRPNGVVTLTTDFGTRDPYVGIMKGVLYGAAPHLRSVADLTHEVPAQDVRTAAFQLSQAAPWFAEGTVHVAVVDPGVGSERRVVLALDRGSLFLAPDNGLLGPVVSPDAPVWIVDVPRFLRADASRTFHGRDLFAPLAARLVEGLAPDEVGEAAVEWERPSFPDWSEDGAGGYRGEVLLVDRFGNLVTNLPGALVAGELQAWEVVIAGRRVPLRGTYAEAARDEALALVDSYGLLEVAVRDGDAARVLSMAPGGEVTLIRCR